MSFQIFTYAMNAFVMIAIPIYLAFLLTRRWKLGWKFWWIGIASFILSQVGHIPFNGWIGDVLNRSGLVYLPQVVQAIINASFLGLSAGIFEEGARYIIFRYWAKDCRSWRNGILLGAGHGGAESMILGTLALVSYVTMLVLKDANLATLLAADQISLAEQQLSAYWSAPWYLTLLGALERIFAITIQLSLTILVLQAFVQKRSFWFFMAILYHAFVDGTVVFLLPHVGIYWTEALVAGFAGLSLMIILFLRIPEPEPEPAEKFPPVKLPQPLAPLEESLENVEKTRFQV